VLDEGLGFIGPPVCVCVCACAWEGVLDEGLGFIGPPLCVCVCVCVHGKGCSMKGQASSVPGRSETERRDREKEGQVRVRLYRYPDKGQDLSSTPSSDTLPLITRGPEERGGEGSLPLSRGALSLSRARRKKRLGRALEPARPIHTHTHTHTQIHT
jgi:hypothetical protein